MEREAEVREQAIRLLARREHSVRELAFKLTRRGVPEELADAVIARLAQEGLQSDARYAESWVRHRVEQGYGPLRIRAELRERGVADAVAGPALAEVERQIDWADLARQVWARRFGTAPADLRERARQQRYLERRGFAAGHIRQVMSAAAQPD
ncbi:recombination regulator RecX [Alkalilimnicola ehrlichii MLHE-1]|uniref:Regulatory protein RecX n=1 Tax=Alkalilimnicola ehrlichii (strain ATCC BAA-1101 / DSM 17681 / MLHE-1) TaxID=187272 RepID=Q0A8K6_ALKEH|nr:recombination regulator RecX [Alkalilimnicola ehrlichii]ABI56831.1 regulatory protein RecX [Alkalilimnicola ehrlichii MLHE-1]